MIYQDNSDAIDKINKEIAEKQKELLELVHGKKDYFECDDEMEELRQSKKVATSGTCKVRRCKTAYQ